MITVISRFRVRKGWRKRYAGPSWTVRVWWEKAAGFCGLNVLTDATNPPVFLLLTRWRDTEIVPSLAPQRATP